MPGGAGAHKAECKKYTAKLGRCYILDGDQLCRLLVTINMILLFPNNKFYYCGSSLKIWKVLIYYSKTNIKLKREFNPIIYISNVTRA